MLNNFEKQNVQETNNKKIFINFPLQLRNMANKSNFCIMKSIFNQLSTEQVKRNSINWQQQLTKSPKKRKNSASRKKMEPCTIHKKANEFKIKMRAKLEFLKQKCDTYNKHFISGYNLFYVKFYSFILIDQTWDATKHLHKTI